MTGREKIEAAFSSGGTRDIPAVICYEGIYVRDHWDQLTARPWWYQHAPDIERQMLWQRDAATKTGQDWFVLPSFYSKEEQRNLTIEERPEGIFLVDRRNGGEEELSPPRVGGWTTDGVVQSIHPDHLIETPDDVASMIPLPSDATASGKVADGKGELAARVLAEFGRGLYPIRHVASPLWRTYSLWGFEGMMLMVAKRPDLVEHACQRYLVLAIQEVREAAALGASGIWIEDCLTDMIRPESFASLNVPFVRSLIEEIRAAGMKSIYYYCGNPAGKWDMILSLGADALSLEESKKNFAIDIEDVVERVQGRCTVLGNLDAVDVLQNGSEEALQVEIARQIAAGRRNGSRFIMSLGSPVTPGTPVERVRRYCDLVHELGTP